ncbi:MAG: DUF2304 domain-containing protein [Lachnospiraceae bacterium]|jgi:hypothetical protein|nr:DUF2304 domain-containing protein [Lachnospiraceae bacterium]MBR3483844.1 DUF2304 domain-containing protein [Lachnospiraceae bacterium]MBR3580468.1 DUF2304 domain-containing protein [Lachnospiraceae bacterium]
MDYGLFLRVVLVLAGVLILLIDIILLAKRRLLEPISMVWGFAGIIFIVAGIVLHPNGWIKYMSEAGMALMIILGFCVVYGLFYASCHLSDIIRKQTEMAMNISLLNQEILELKRDIAEHDKEIDAKLK